MQVFEFHGAHHNFGRQIDLTYPQREDAIPPDANVRRSFDTSALERPTYFEDDDCRDCELTRVERGVATSSCRPSEPWHLLRQPQDGVRIEQEGHRIVR